ncbi:hypothetical protein HPB48_004462 [Haemaphysalis longicornis]|uniref:Uncharacterized protein n=1 Tax=Haemaphysalis longicornis TaxID=44386 RepID=A0A9J6FQK7_HAELO|nr:hypothetical protein HPB48_004462 [Haemaphysalis longicornis]
MRPSSPPSAPGLAITSLMDEVFSIAELIAALISVEKATSPVPDNMSYTALFHLGEKKKKCLLSIFNHSWETGGLEQKWKHGRTVALLKPGKIPTSIESYHRIVP